MQVKYVNSEYSCIVGSSESNRIVIYADGSYYTTGDGLCNMNKFDFYSDDHRSKNKIIRNRRFPKWVCEALDKGNAVKVFSMSVNEKQQVLVRGKEIPLKKELKNVTLGWSIRWSICNMNDEKKVNPLKTYTFEGEGIKGEYIIQGEEYISLNNEEKAQLRRYTVHKSLEVPVENLIRDICDWSKSSTQIEQEISQRVKSEGLKKTIKTTLETCWSLKAEKNHIIKVFSENNWVTEDVIEKHLEGSDVKMVTVKKIPISNDMDYEFQIHVEFEDGKIIDLVTKDFSPGDRFMGSYLR